MARGDKKTRGTGGQRRFYGGIFGSDKRSSLGQINSDTEVLKTDDEEENEQSQEQTRNRQKKMDRIRVREMG